MLEYRNEIIGSLGIHLLLGISLALGESCAPKIHPAKKVTMVTAISLPVQKSDVVTKATQRPAAKEAPTPKESAPDPAPVIEPPAPDQMILKEEKKEEPKEEKKEEPKEKPKKEPPKKDPPKEEPKEESNKDEREALMRKMEQEEKRRKLLDGIAEGPVDREASSPDGVDNPPKGANSLGKSSPEIAAYMAKAKALILPNWNLVPNPYPNPEYKVTIQVSIDSSGNISNPRVISSSGDKTFDKSATRSLLMTGNISSPPKKWIDDGGKSITITLAASDK